MSKARRSISVFVLGLAVACGLVAPSFPLAQVKRPMTLIDLIEAPRVSDPQLSDDGRQVAYVVERADWKQNRRIGHIWRANVDGSGAMQMTYGEKGESGPRWSPDGKRIAFLARRGEAEETQIYLIDNDGGEAKPLSTHAASVSNISWAPDGGSLYFVAADPKTAEEKERDKVKDDVYAFDENYKQHHLWKIAVADGVEQKLSDGDHSVLNYDLSPDGTKIVLHRAPSPLFGDSDQGEVWVMSARGADPIRLTRNSLPENGGALSPDGSQVLFLSDTNDKSETYYNDNLFLVPAAGGTPRALLPDFPYEIQEAAWSANGRSIFLVANMGVHSELFQIDVSTKAPKQLTGGKHSIQGWTLANGDRQIFQLDEPERFGDIWMMAGASATPARVTKVYDYLEREFQLPQQEKVEWKGADGVSVEGLVHYPLDYQPGKRYPLCVQTHGGPQSSDRYGFSGGLSSYVPVLAAKGYLVLKPNYRGSTGYGNAFLRDMVGSYFKNSHLDVMAGVDHVIKMGLADPDRMVKMGWSAGGHMTNKIITYTDRFKAASSGAGAANWISMYAQSDIRTYRTPWFGGTPWQKNAPYDIYWEHSPLKYVANVKTPTIFLVGESDPRVPPPQSVEMHRALKTNGVPTRLYMAPREPHSWGELRHQLFKMNVELEWFDKHAMGRAYTWEKAPAGDNEKAKTSMP